VSTVDLATLEGGLLAGERGALSRAITLIESNRPRHQEQAEELLNRLMPRTGGSMRVGVTGAPGAGKSTFIECLGTMLTGRGHRVAVLAVDPSSGVSGGSIMGDKTRMERLGVDPNAFVRPSPSAGSLGGVASKTRESMLACEAAGFDVVLIETVGVGQSETAVADMTDFYLALMIPGAGDELQGIKRGLLELADMIAVNKSDGEMLSEARRALATYKAAVHMAGTGGDWEVPVVACSAQTGDGIDELWGMIAARLGELRTDGRLETRRRAQMLGWMWSSVDARLRALTRGLAGSDPRLASIVERVRRGGVLPPIAARAFVGALVAGAEGIGERADSSPPGGEPIGSVAPAGTERGAR
jgi:LAO/AO transport system kinase